MVMPLLGVALCWLVLSVPLCVGLGKVLKLRSGRWAPGSPGFAATTLIRGSGRHTLASHRSLADAATAWERNVQRA